MVEAASAAAVSARRSVLLVSSNSSTFELDPATGQIGRQIANGRDGVVSPNRTSVAYVRVTDPCPTVTAPEEPTTTTASEETTTSTVEPTTTTVPEESTTTLKPMPTTSSTVAGETTTTIPELPPCSVAAADLLTADITGAGERTIVTSVDEPLDRFSPDWAPDGSRILFSWSEIPAGGALSWVRPDGSGLETLAFGAKHGTFSPDGKAIAYVDRSTGDLHVMNVATRRTTALTTDGTDGTGGPPDWSPDGRRITYATQQGVFVLDAKTGEAVNLTQGWAAPVGSFETAVYSPGGNEIAFVALDFSAYPDGEAVRRVYVVSASGGEPRTVATQDGRLTDWLRL